METILVLDEKNYTDDMPVFEKTGVRAIICKDGRYAMQYSADGEYKIPGGGMEAGESCEETLIREVREETGLKVLPETIKEIGEITEIREDLFKKGTKYICHSLFYSCDVSDEVGEMRLTPSEVLKGYTLQWATVDEIIECNTRLLKDKWTFRDTEFLKWLRQNLEE